MKFVDDIFSLVWDLKGWIENWADNIWTWIPFHEWFQDKLYKIANWLWTVLTPIAHFHDWVDDIVKKVATFLDAAGILKFLQSWLTYAQDAWNWVYSAPTNVGNILLNWWAAISPTVQGWISIAKEAVLSVVATVDTALTTLQSKWDDFKTITLPTLATNLNVVALVSSTLKSWFPQYDTEAEQLPTRISFFTSPLDWLLNEFTDWFLGKE